MAPVCRGRPRILRMAKSWVAETPENPRLGTTSLGFRDAICAPRQHFTYLPVNSMPEQ